MRTIPRRVAGLLVVATLVAVSGHAAQWFGTPDVDYDNFEYNGKFTFSRIRFEPTRWGPSRQYAWGLDLKWNHDYPRAEANFGEILGYVTGLPTNQGGGNIVGLDDPELFRYPWAYLCEVGFWSPTDEEVENLRNYLLKGGFIVVDDFDGYAWYNFEEQMQRVIPGARFFDLDPNHEIFHSFFTIDDLSFGRGRRRGGFNRGGGPFDYGAPRYLGLFEDNDPSKRLMVVANYNQDIGEYWEYSGSGYVAIDIENDAYKLGVNYVIYAMSH